MEGWPLASLLRFSRQFDSFDALFARADKGKKNGDLAGTGQAQLEISDMARFRSWHVGDVDHVKLYHLVKGVRRCRFQPGLVARGTIVGRAQIGAVQMIDSGHVRVAIDDQVFNDGGAVASKIIS